jgi:hypothetical protein
MMNAPSTARQKIGYSLPTLVVGALALLLYVATAAPWITWAHDGADGGDLITAAMTWGVPHPSGYPVYCLLGRLFALLPLGSVARRFNLFSVAWAAAAVSLVYLAAIRILASTREANRQTRLDVAMALLVALAFAASPTLWSQATIAEVYAPHTFFFALCLYLATRLDPQSPSRHWALLGLALGLGLGLHLTLSLIVPGLALLLWPKAKPARLGAFGLGTALGLASYVYLPLAARGDPPVNWGDARTWSGFWWVISGKVYLGYLFGLPARYLPARLGAWAGLWLQQFTWIGLALAITGLWSWSERRRRWALATGCMFVAYAVYAVTYDTTDSYVYLLPTYVLTALWMAEGARAIVASLATTQHRAGQLRIALALLVLASIPIWSLLRHYKALDLSHDHTAAQWVEKTFSQLPPGALLITGEDAHTFTLDYVRWVERRRQDLIVIDGELLQQPWYAQQVARRYPSLQGAGKTSSLSELISANLGQRDVYLSSPRDGLAQSFEIAPVGNLWRISGR